MSLSNRNFSAPLQSTVMWTIVGQNIIIQCIPINDTNWPGQVMCSCLEPEEEPFLNIIGGRQRVSELLVTQARSNWLWDRRKPQMAIHCISPVKFSWHTDHRTPCRSKRKIGQLEVRPTDKPVMFPDTNSQALSPRFCNHIFHFSQCSDPFSHKNKLALDAAE